ncbi:cell division protein FtsX [Paracandidimonas soli]|uniref:Cell division protein FtsX n=1 Tax=Paracandidimonas soli TaxID=1917182 RepID=A0A4R3VFH5_9BURK|nr:ABC transporter permease [Paracandidimonas soli]TCV02991.1 cell division protein FtsX [Paracandidimonas soli]
MRRWLRQHHYALMVSLRRLAKQPFSSIANVLVIALSLTLPIVGASILLSAQPVLREVSVSPQLTLFLEQNVTAEQNRALAQQLQRDHGDVISSVQSIPKAQALNNLKSNPGWSSALSVLPGNPLPDALVVSLRDSENQAEEADRLAADLADLDGVDTVQLDSEWVRRLQAIMHTARIGLGLLGLGVILVVLATVFNTVRMQALTQREEIAVARLVGATETFVRRPFLYLGAMTGIAASLIAIGVAALALVPLNEALGHLAASYGAQFALQLPDASSLLLATVAVAILGAAAARWSVTRNTRF